MKTPKLSNRPHRSGRTPRPAQPAMPFKVFIGYADAAAVRRAMCTVADAIRASGRNVQLQPLVWRFAQLESTHWRDRAITAALAADVVVLASSERGELPNGVESWVNAFLVANRGRRVTIVSVAGTSDAWTISIEQPLAHVAHAPTELPLLSGSEEMVA